MENNTLFMNCNDAIEKILSRYPSYMRACLFAHEDEEILTRLYEIMHILMNGETPEETARKEEIVKANKAVQRATHSAVRCSALNR